MTTKADVSSYTRGVGLYLNRLLLRDKYDGDDYLVGSKPGIATTFCVKLRYEPYKYKGTV